MSANVCPDRQQLQRLLAGPDTAVDELAALAEHLEHCARCADTVHGLQGADTFVQLVRAARAGRPREEEDVVEQLVKRITLLGYTPSPPATASPGLVADRGEEVAGQLAPPQGPDEIGRLGPYRVLRLLGSGGMGVVFEAEDTRLRRRVALKVLKPPLAAGAEARGRFEAEALAMAAVEHDHVVPIYQVGEENGVAFLAMPLLKGESLESRLRREGKLAPAEAVRVGREVALGLSAAHARDLIHRDVKPANIWLEARDDAPSGRVKLLDFGLARAAAADARQTQPGTVIGTPAYMAPEQAADGPVDARADLFSLGCVLYRITTGRDPFAGPNPLAVLRAVESEHPPRPDQVDPAVPAPLARLIQRLLAKAPADRPPSALAAVEALDALAAGAMKAAARPADTAPTIRMPAPSRKSGRRLRLQLAAGAAAALVLVAAGVLVPRLWPPKAPETGNKPADADKKDLPRLGIGGVVTDAPPLPGAKGWTIVTVAPRGRTCAVAFRPGTNEVATVSEDDVIRLWDAATGRLVRAIVPRLPKQSALWRLPVIRSKPIRGSTLAWKADGVTLGCGLPTGEVYLIDAKTGRVTPFETTLGVIASMAWSRDGNLLAVGIDGGKRTQVKVLDVHTKRQVALMPDAEVDALAFSPDGELLAACGNGSHIWDINTEKSLPAAGKLAHRVIRTGALAWARDGKALALGGWLCELKPGGKPRDLAVGDVRELEKTPVLAGHWKDEGKTLVLYAGETIKTYDVAKGKKTHEVPLKRSPSYSWDVGEFDAAAFSGDGKILAGRVWTTFSLWNSASGTRERDFPAPSGDTYWCASQDGRRLITIRTGDDTIRRYDTTSGSVVKAVTRTPHTWYDAGGSASGKYVLLGGTLFDATNLREIVRLQAVSAAWAPKADILAYGRQKEKGIHILEVESNKSRVVLKDLPTPTALAWSADGKKLAVGEENGNAAVYDLEGAAKPVPMQIPRNAWGTFGALTWSPDGKWLAVIRGLMQGWPTMRSWVCDASSGKVREELPGWGNEHAADFVSPQALAHSFSPDGKLLAQANIDGRVELYDTESWEPKRTLRVPRSFPRVNKPAWADGGKTLLVSAGAADIEVFDVKTGRRRGVLWPLWHEKGVAIGANGHYSGTLSKDAHQIAYVVQTAKGQETFTPAQFAKRFKWTNKPGEVRLLGD
jgi:WD40 repeat protein